MNPLRLFTLGTLRLEDDAAGDLLRGRRKELVLLAYLVRRAPRATRRTELAALLWEDSPEAKGRHSLRQALHNLRQAVGADLEVGAQEVRLLGGGLEADATAFEADLAAGRLSRAVQRWEGDFLPATEDVGGEVYRAWLEAERERLRQLLRWALDRLASEAEERGEWVEAVEWARRAAHWFRYDEALHLRLVQALRLAGRWGDAVAEHSAFVTRLRGELAETPSETFLRLGQSLREEASATAVRQPGSAALFTPDLVERGPGFAALTAAWTSVAAGAGAVLLIEGDEGLGKTRLCQELLHWLRGREPRPFLLHAKGVEGDADTPYSTLRRLLAGLSGANGLAGAPDAALAELSALAPSIRDRFPRLPEPIGTVPALTTALHEVLRDVGVEAPVLLLLDDLPLADAATQRTVLSLGRDPPPSVLVLFTGSSALLDASDLGTTVRRLAPLRRIPLRRLSESGMDALVGSMLALAPDARRRLVHRLYTESGGTPLYAVELVSALVEEGLISLGSDGTWRILPELEHRVLPLPARIRDATRERLARLDPNARLVLEAAAWMDPPLEPTALEAAAGLPLSDFANALDTLIARRLLRPAAAEANAFEFTHEVVRRAAQEQVSYGRRHELRRDALQRAARAHERPASSADVVILPFTVTGREEHRVLGEGMLDLLAAALDGTGGLRCADPRMTLDHLAALPRKGSMVEKGQRAAEYFDTRWFVLGTLVAAGGQVRIGATVFQAGRPPRVASRLALDGPEADLLRLLDRTAVELLLRLNAGAPSGLLHQFQHRTASLGSLRAYLDGEAALRQGELDRAIDAFREATSEDPGFALAYYRLAHALEWTYQPDSPRLSAEALFAAVRLVDRLPEQMRVLVRARLASMRGAGEEAVRLFRSVVAMAPDNIEAWYGLGCAVFHFAQLWGGTLVEAREPFEQVLAREPEHVTAMAHLASIAAIEKRGSDLLALTQRILKQDQRSVHFMLRLAVRLQLAYGLPDAALQEQVLAELRSAGDNEVGSLPVFAFLLGEDLDAAARAMTLMTELGRSHDRMATGHALLASLELARGRWTAARSRLELAERYDDALALEYLALFACSPFLSVPADELRAIRKKLRRWRPTSGEEVPPSLLLGVHQQLHPLLLRYLDGLLSVRLEEWPTAERAAFWLEQAEPPQVVPTLGPGLAKWLRAHITAARGDPGAAIDVLDRSRPEIPWHLLVGSGILSGAHERLLRGELLFRLGRFDEARRWFLAATGVSPFDVVLLAPAALGSAETAEALGDRDEAIRQYRRFLGFWRDCDPGLRPRIDAATERLARIEAGVGPGDSDSTHGADRRVAGHCLPGAGATN